MRTSPALVIVALVAAGVGGLGLYAWSHEARIEDVVERETRALDAARPVTEDSRRVGAALARVDALLESCDASDENPGVPGKWGPGSDYSLRAEVAWYANFYAEVDELVADPAFGRVLESGARLEKRTSLMWTRSRTNLLCARALIDARDGDGAEAARRLAQALDLSHVEFGPSALDAMIVAAVDGIVLDALGRMLATGTVDLDPLRALLAPRLERAVDPRRFAASLRGEAVEWLVAGHRANTLSERLEFWQIGQRALQRLDELDAGASSVPDILFPGLLATAMTSDVERTSGLRMAHARIALAAVAHHGEFGVWPTRLEDMARSAGVGPDGAAACTWFVANDETHLFVATGPHPKHVVDWTLR
ncbi:MAG: hypothetical protein NTY35_07570 [Planctomycetota bacterium]|nr:hypothetical protein [Planctomycetota bacterium]